MADLAPEVRELFELANNYPSPHNGQPIQLVPVNDTTFQLFFVTARGLSATPISHLFSFVTVGVFVRHLERCAEALGHRVMVDLDLPEYETLASGGRVSLGSVRLQWRVAEPQPELADVISRRQTSRKKYTQGLREADKQELMSKAAADSLRLTFLSSAQAKQTIWLNQRAVFDDMFDPAVRQELDHWLRYTPEEKHAKQDGLSFDCMELSGRAMKFSVRHYKVLHWPIIAPLLQQYYLRTMSDDSSIGYLSAPFTTSQHAYAIGRFIIDMWLDLTQGGYYLHPFGTVVSNDQAHADFLKIVGKDDENRETSYVSFIFRAGTSAVPVESERLPIDKQLYNQT